jgi:hypothetical protein
LCKDTSANWALVALVSFSICCQGQELDTYPDSKRNLAAFTDFACRANDALTYKRLRARVSAEVFGSMSRIPLERCDARFTPK